MYFKNLHLENFRNYKSLDLEFDKNLNLILGDNAQGKTNLIEGLYIMGLGKSFRTNNDQEMIAFESDYSKAVSTVEDEDYYGDNSGKIRETEIEIIFRKEGKLLKTDGVKLQKTVDLLENVYIVIFSPDDLKIIKEGPEQRRKFLDRELCQLKPLYYSDLGNYKKVLKQRNYLLKEKNKDKQLFDVFDEALAEYGLRIARERNEFVKKLLVISSGIHSDISGGKEKFEMSYESKISDDMTKEEYKSRLQKDIENDYYKGYTSFGPHKDDIAITINGTDIRNYGSQGQQRTAALSLKLAEIGLIRQETGKNAVLLLDDVLSELDTNRQQYLIESMKGIQVFITAAQIDENLAAKLPEGKRFTVDNGQVHLYNK